MRYLCLCVEVPEDLEKFDYFELVHDNGHSFFLFYKNKGNKAMRFLISSIRREYLKVRLSERLKNGLQKKNEKKLVPEKLPARSRCKKNKLG